MAEQVFTVRIQYSDDTEWSHPWTPDDIEAAIDHHAEDGLALESVIVIPHSFSRGGVVEDNELLGLQDPDWRSH